MTSDTFGTAELDALSLRLEVVLVPAAAGEGEWPTTLRRGVEVEAEDARCMERPGDNLLTAFPPLLRTACRHGQTTGKCDLSGRQ